MTKQEFCQRVKKELESNYFSPTDGFQINNIMTRKNNDITLHSIVIRKDDNPMCPTFHLDDFFNTTPDVAANSIANAYMEQLQEEKYQIQEQISKVLDFDKAKQYICYKIINSERNKLNLQDKPSVPVVGDLRAVFYVRLSEEASVTITNEIIKNWGIDEKNALQILFDYASRNTERLKPATLEPLQDVLLKIAIEKAALDPNNPFIEEISELVEERKNAASSYAELFILSTKDSVNGASAILYQKGQQLESALKEISRITGAPVNSIFILPSSIHELLLLPDSGFYSKEELQVLVQSVNQSSVDPKEFLSDQIFHYDRQHGLQMLTMENKNLDLER